MSFSILNFVLGAISMTDQLRLPQSESYGYEPSRIRNINNCLSQEDESLVKNQMHVDVSDLIR